MKYLLRYGLLVFCFSCLGCSCKKEKKLDTRVSLWRMDKIPYGTQYAYEHLSAVFPNADIRTSRLFPKIYPEENAEDTLRALIILTPAFIPEPEEMNSLIRFAAAGNQVFISARFFEDTVMDMLHLTPHRIEIRPISGNTGDSAYAKDFVEKKERKVETGMEPASRAAISILDPARKAWVKYAYPGEFSENSFDTIDTVHSRILGRNDQGDPDFVRIAYAHRGAIYIHLEPRAFSNFFLLHKENKSYYDLALSWLPGKTAVVEWSDYFRYSHQADNYSAFQFLLGNRSLRWAFWLTLLLFVLIFLIESKRKQRPIAEIPKLRNASEDFVKTVSRLYFQQKNNQNLAGKMINALLENIRSAYNLSTVILDEEFARKLAFRTGRPVSEISELVKSIHDARLKANLTDREIMDLHQKINQFNKPAS